MPSVWSPPPPPALVSLPDKTDQLSHSLAPVCPAEPTVVDCPIMQGVRPGVVREACLPWSQWYETACWVCFAAYITLSPFHHIARGIGYSGTPEQGQIISGSGSYLDLLLC